MNKRIVAVVMSAAIAAMGTGCKNNDKADDDTIPMMSGNSEEYEEMEELYFGEDSLLEEEELSEDIFADLPEDPDSNASEETAAE